MYDFAKNGPATLLTAKIDIFESAMNFMRSHGGALEVGKAYLDDPLVVRKELVENIKYIAHKTASFLYLVLGGERNLLTFRISTINLARGDNNG